MPTQNLKLQDFRTLEEQGNYLSTAVPGSLEKAENVDLDRRGVPVTRRGFRLSGALDATTSFGTFYGNNLVVLEGTKLRYSDDFGETWNDVTGGSNISAPSGSAVQAIKSGGSLFLLTDDGLLKLDSITGTLRPAGMPQGLDIDLALTGTGGSWYLEDSKIGYVVLFVRIDANGKEVLGAVSSQSRIVNSITEELDYTFAAGEVTVTHTDHGFTTGDTVEISDVSDADAENGSHTITVLTDDTYKYSVSGTPANGTLSDAKRYDIEVTTTLPDLVIAGDYVEIHRANFTDTDDDDVGPDHFFVKRIQIEAADITAGTITFTDIYDESFLGARTYTNASLDTLRGQRNRPFWGRYMDFYKGFLEIGDIRQEHELDLRLLSVSGLSDGTSAITITDGVVTLTYTFEAAEDIGNQEFQRFTNSISSVNVENTMRSLVRVINRDTNNTIVYAHYVSAETDDQVGKIKLIRRDFEDTAFSVIADASGTGDNFEPELPTSGETIISSANEKPSGLARSRHEQIEAFPRLLVKIIDPEESSITGLKALPDSVLIYTDNGMFIQTGEDDGRFGDSFVYDLEDDKKVLLAPKTLVKLDNTAIAYTSTGAYRSTGAGSSIISQDIRQKLLRTQSFSGFADDAFAVAYEPDNRYILFTKTTNGQATNNLAYVWHGINGSWTTMTKKVAWAAVSPGKDGKLFLGHAVEPYVLIERKDYKSSDHKDETVDVTLSNVDTTSVNGVTYTTARVTYTWSETFLTGGTIVQNNTKAYVSSFSQISSTVYDVVLDREVTSFVAGAAEYSLPISWAVEPKPQTGGDPSMLKDFVKCHITLERDRATLISLSFRGDTQTAYTTVGDLYRQRRSGWGKSPWGKFPWGNPRVLIPSSYGVPVPWQHRKCRAISVKLSHQRADEKVALLQMALETIPIGMNGTFTRALRR